MLIALDYDGTYTVDPAFWDGVIGQAQASGHEVICVTMRHPHEAINMPCEVIYTSREAKAPHMAALQRMPKVWIDDSPHWIFQRSA